MFTPFEKMSKFNTTILGIGTEYFRSLSQVHIAEHLLGDKFPMKLTKDKTTITIIDENGNRFNYIHNYYTDPRHFNRGHDVLKKYLSKGQLVEWTFHGVPMYCTKADAITQAALQAAADGKTIYDH